MQTPPPRALMLFAAGLGTRMGALVRDRPKPLIEVGGKPLIAHALAQRGELELDHVVANAHYLAPQIAAYCRPRGIAVHVEAPELLDTGGGLKAALPLLGGGAAVFTLNTDAVWAGPPALPLLAKAWNPHRMDALLLCVPQGRAVGRIDPSGDFNCPEEDGQLERGGNLVFTGAQIVKLRVILQVARQVFSLNMLWDRLIVQGALFGALYPGHWNDAGTPEGLLLAQKGKSRNLSPC